MAFGVTPTDVAAYADGAPPVSQNLIDRAEDWVEGQLAGVTPSTDRQVRHARWAVCAYALSLAGGEKAAASRATSGASKVKVGTIEVTKGSAESASASLDQLADDRLAQAWEHLYEAGKPRPRLGAGVTR